MNEIKNNYEKDLKEDKTSYLGSIKSFWNIEIIFSFLEEKKQLNMIKYNKYFQNKMGINIEIYKDKSRKYKIDGINGYGKEFDLTTDKLIFEGEYRYQKRNGKGKEYDYFGELQFEGEYLNGFRNEKERNIIMVY